MQTAIFSDEEMAFLEKATNRIAKMVRRINRYVDDPKHRNPSASGVTAKYRAEVDLLRLSALAEKDPTGRVESLLSVCAAIAESEASGWKMRVLNDRWQPDRPSQWHDPNKGKMGNVLLTGIAFSREEYLAAVGGERTVKVRRPTRPRTRPAANGGIEVVVGNVEDIAADAVVNAANEHLAAGSGICGAIFRKAGYEPLQAACDQVAPCPTGEARITPAFGITNAKFIIHAVGPDVRRFGMAKSPVLLENCYRNLFKVALENGCRSVAVPSISTGIYGYPIKDATEIAVREAKIFAAAHPDFKIIFVVWGGGPNKGVGTKKLYEGLLQQQRGVRFRRRDRLNE